MHTEYATNVKLSDGYIRDLFFFLFPEKKKQLSWYYEKLWN